MKLYKLTDSNDKTHGGCQWGEGITVITSGEGVLCGKGFTHWYTSPLLAVLLNPIHGSFDLRTAHLWEGEGEVIKNDHGLKVGCTRATTLRRIDIPTVNTTQRVAFGILCAMEVCSDPGWRTWAQNWLNNADRTAASAEAAVKRAVEAAAAEWAAEWAARGAAWGAVERAAEAAAEAAWAAEAAARAETPLDLQALAEKAMKVK